MAELWGSLKDGECDSDGYTSRTKKTGKRGFHSLCHVVALFGMLSLCGGCLVDASKLAGFSNPSLEVKRTPWGFTFKAGSDFKGEGSAEYNPETGQFKGHVLVTSDPTPVINAEASRADHLVELRRIETTYYLEAQKTVGENFQAFGNMLAIAAQGGGAAVAKVVESAAPLLTASAPLLGTLMGPVNALAGAAVTPQAIGTGQQAPVPATPATGGVRLPGAATFETQKLPDKPAENTTVSP